jgi:hypothetical protein
MMAKPAPVTAAEFIVTGVVPVDVRVNISVVDVFTATLPNCRLVVPTVSCGFPLVPVPLKGTTVVLPLVESLLIVSCPVADPVAFGSN